MSESFSWQEEFQILNRRPRAGIDFVSRYLKSHSHPEIELREDPARNTTEIVLRFRGCSEELPLRLREIYFQQGMTLERAFQEVLRGKLRPNDQRTARSQLAGDAYNALQATWIHIVKMLYFETTHSKANRHLVEEIEGLKKSTSLGRGQGQRSNADDANLWKRYQDLLAKAKLVRQAVVISVDPGLPENNDLGITAVRKRIWARVKDELYGTRAAHLIFSGRAFHVLSAQKKRGPVRLHVPSDWEPEGLATALLADEEGKEYRTMRRSLKRLARKLSTIST